MKINIITFVVAAFVLIIPAGKMQAQDNQAVTISLSLKEAQEYAIDNNANIKNSIIDIEIAKKKIKETTAIGLPQISAKAQYQNIFKAPMISFGDVFVPQLLPSNVYLTKDDIQNAVVTGPAIPLSVKENSTLDLTLSQLIFSGEYLVGLQAAKVFYLISEQSRQKTELDLHESVSNTYNLVLVLNETHQILQKSYDNLKKTLAEMRAMNEQGFIENTDVDQIELTSLNLENGLKSLSRQYDAATYLLKFQLGMPFDSNIVLTDKLENTATEIPLDIVLETEFKLDNNINYQILKTQESLAELNLKREKSTYLPTLAAVYNHQEKANKPEFDFAPKDVLAVQMNIPIFASGMKHYKVNQRKLELEKVVNVRETLANGLELEYINVKNELITAYDKFQNDKKNIELTQRVYEKTLIKFKEGLSSSLDLTNAQNQYLTAQSNYFNSIYTVITAKNKLQKLTNTK